MKLYLVEYITEVENISWQKFIIDTELGLLIDEHVIDSNSQFFDKTIDEYAQHWITGEVNVTYIGEL